MTQIIKIDVLPGFAEAMEVEAVKVRKAAVAAIKVEAFRLRKVGKMLLRKGVLDIEKTSFLEYKDNKKGKSVAQKDNKNRGALRSFHSGFIYKFNNRKIEAEIGFIGDSAGTSWQRPILEKSLPGYNWVYTKRERDRLHSKGIHLKEKTKHGDTPKRDIIKAVVEHEGASTIVGYVKLGFDRKMRGERI